MPNSSAQYRSVGGPVGPLATIAFAVTFVTLSVAFGPAWWAALATAVAAFVCFANLYFTAFEATLDDGMVEFRSVLRTRTTRVDRIRSIKISRGESRTFTIRFEGGKADMFYSRPVRAFVDQLLVANPLIEVRGYSRSG